LIPTVADIADASPFDGVPFERVDGPMPGGVGSPIAQKQRTAVP
jgi:hypothetical protein